MNYLLLKESPIKSFNSRTNDNTLITFVRTCLTMNAINLIRASLVDLMSLMRTSLTMTLHA